MNFLFIVLSLLSTSACAAGKITTITPPEAKSLRDAQKAIIVDVREAAETAEGMLQGAVALPLSGLQSNDPATLKALEGLDKQKTLILYCRSGRRSAAAGELLAAKGYLVKNLGGYSDAKAAGL